MLKLLLVLAVLGASVYSSPVPTTSWTTPAYCGSYECPRFKLIRDAGSYQVREYEEAWWVGTNAAGGGLFSNTGLFLRLFRYIFGNNERDVSIEMTVPVTMYVSLGTTNRTMSFYLPIAQQSNPPQPSDPAVKLERRAALTVYVKSFGGYAFEKEYKAAFDSLVADIGDNNLYHTHHFYGLGYDMPAKFWSRHNEVWLMKK